MFHIAAAGFVDVRFLYAGYQYDKRLGLYHVRHRVYHPHLGRWLQPDPLGYIDGWNLYAYIGSSPMSFVDPWGLMGDTWFGRAAYWIQGKTADTAVGRVAGIIITAPLYMHDYVGGAILDAGAAVLEDPGAAIVGAVRAPYDRAVAAHVNAYGERPGTIDLAIGIAGEISGMSGVAAGIVGFDPVENRSLDSFEERGERIAIGVSMASGGAATGVTLLNVTASGGLRAGQSIILIVDDGATGSPRIGYRYVSSGEVKAIGDNRNMVPNVSFEGKPKGVFYTVDDPLFSSSEAVRRYQLDPNRPPTHRVTIDVTDARPDYAGHVRGGSGIELITNCEMPTLRVDPLLP